MNSIVLLIMSGDTIAQPSFADDLLWLLVFVLAPVAVGMALGMALIPLLRGVRLLIIVGALAMVAVVLLGVDHQPLTQACIDGARWVISMFDGWLPGRSVSANARGASAAFAIGVAIGLVVYSLRSKAQLTS